MTIYSIEPGNDFEINWDGSHADVFGGTTHCFLIGDASAPSSVFP
jgi:hypothetical protein